MLNNFTNCPVCKTPINLIDKLYFDCTNAPYTKYTNFNSKHFSQVLNRWEEVYFEKYIITFRSDSTTFRFVDSFTDLKIKLIEVLTIYQNISYESIIISDPDNDIENFIRNYNILK